MTEAKLKNVYFLGIGGIGMSAIARWYKFRGYEVSGYDRTPSPLTASLEAEGIGVHYEDDPSRIPADKASTLVVYTPAVPAELSEMQFVLANGYKVVKRARALGEITRDQTCLAVAGTHGKTTTSTLIAHILTESGDGCSAFLGGISKNYGTNLLMSHNPTVVAEADEFDRSFLQLHPDIAVITAMDADHLDIYGDLEHVQEAFREFASQVHETIILKYGLPIKGNQVSARIFTYHFDDPRADFHSTNLRLDDSGHYTFDLAYPGGTLKDIRCGTLGWVNVENSIAAAAACLCHGADGQKVRHAIGSFKGAMRRLDERVNRPGLVYIDDYAHHPAELSSAISSIRGIFPGRKITGIFQPHLFTRTRDFAPEFAAALSGLDKLILLDIYPAREEPIPGVSSELIFKDVTAPEKVLIRKEELMDALAKEKLDVLVTFGAGNIDRFVEPITQMLQER
ncbi:MAG: UDP-N-acetylmuramate--L-alanine ligase [Bacteroidales bacterium]|jgi:UDP-N-acetylmuramate--alanine ligase|nr:UDP-N-acetylmuramate--L-alanine ligase [Bacteroidales bacterium]MBQ2544464.1 UDP-N-acetylmuramate--L-alanine ligase [Bacteroidales bacterium]MBQ3942011.1 UDP-N-acetylmuramate--L-alanine ligase [Bacteroidales bacterium]MBQ4201060.1 UDP-N-acetylmuramate--L-alanine ligase [Bacteroidales bacterium]